MTIPLWVIPAVLTLVVWASLLIREPRRFQGDYGHIGDGMADLAQFLFCVILTLLLWLGYFMARTFNVE